jgi:hypothetical protein
MTQQGQSPGILQRIVQFFANLFDQFMMLLDLPTVSRGIDGRLTRLRRIYYPNPEVSTSYRRVRDVLRGHVDKAYFDYYDRLLANERAVYEATRKFPRTRELLEETQHMGNKIVGLIEQLQTTDHVARIYKKSPDSEPAREVAEAREQLVKRIEEALMIQAGIPAKIISYSTVKAERGIDRLQESIQRLSNQLDDIALSYAEIDAYRQTRLQLLSEPLESLDDSSDNL